MPEDTSATTASQTDQGATDWKTWLPWVIAIAAVIVAILFVSGVLVAKAEVPDTVGDSQTAATTALEDAGFEVDRIEQVYDPEVLVGTVIVQAPEGGSDAPKGSLVTLVVSRGFELTMIPDVSGMTVEEANETLVAAGLRPEFRDTPSDSVAVGIVIYQDPEPNLEVGKGTVVTAVVSSGEEVIYDTVPDVQGMDEADATQMLQDAGFGVKTASILSDEIDGTVLGQMPQPGSSVVRGSEVLIAVSGGKVVTVPDVVGLERDDAVTLLVESDLVALVIEVPSATVPEGEVISQLPAADVEITAGTEIAILVSSGSDGSIPGTGTP